MKRSSKSTFDNILLKRWLLKVGPVRRKILLTKKAERDDRIKGPRSRSEPSQSPPDGNNNNNELVNREFRPIATSSDKRERVKYKRKDLNQKRDRPGYPKCNATSTTVSMPCCEKDKVGKTGESKKKHSTGLHKNKQSDKSHSKKKRSAHKEGDNPNSINWHLIPTAMETPLPSPGARLLQLRQLDKKKKDRLYAKFLEIFGEDIDPYENYKNRSHNSAETKEMTEEHTPPEVTVKCADSKGARRNDETLGRKSPVFANVYRKRKSKDHVSKKRQKSKSAETPNTLGVSVTSNNASAQPRRDSLFSEEETNSLQGDESKANWTVSIDPLLGDRATPVFRSEVVEEFDSDTCSTICTISKTTETHKEAKANLKRDCEGEAQTEGDPLGLTLTIESDQESSDTIDASQILVEKIPVSRQQSVIVKLDKNRNEPINVSFIKSNLSLQSEPVINQEMNFSSEVKDQNSSVPEDGAFTVGATEDKTKLQIPHLDEKPLPLWNKRIKTESVDQNDPAVSHTRGFHWTFTHRPDQQPPNSDSSTCSSDAADNDPNPSSTTNMKSSDTLKSGLLCASDRLLGALDNIYLTLHCKRRVQERMQAASKLAIQRNRQEEELNAQLEFETKLVIFREEIRYLFHELETWDRLLRFIAQGLEHRTPAGIKHFSAAEVESAMLDADVKPLLNINKEESLTIPKRLFLGGVACTINLTKDNRNGYSPVDLCDSSTDPPRSQNHPILTAEAVNTDTDGSWTHDLNANEIQRPVPSIAEVKTISPQQFETLGNRSVDSSVKEDYPCYLCSRTSNVACGLCTKATYCSKDCQEIHWEQSHHATCVPLKIEIVSCNT